MKLMYNKRTREKLGDIYKIYVGHIVVVLFDGAVLCERVWGK